MKYRVMPEKTLFIDLPKTDGLRIKGILRGSLKQPLVVMMHGRPDSGNSLLQYLGARYLYERGVASLRLFMYDTKPKTRNLLDCTLQTHVGDFEIVVRYLQEHNVPKIFGVGHSYGGITILLSKVKLDGAVLWDPSHGSYWGEMRGKRYENEFPEKTVEDIVIGLSGKGYIFPKIMDEQDNKLGDTSKLAAHKGYPLKLIAAGKGAMADLGKRYIDAADEPKQFVEIAEAGHSFYDSDEVMLRLFEETTSWFEDIVSGKISVV